MSIGNTGSQLLLEWFASETGMLNVGTNIKVQATVVIQRAKHNRKYLSTFGEDNVLPLPSHFSALLGMNYDKDTKYIS